MILDETTIAMPGGRGGIRYGCLRRRYDGLLCMPFPGSPSSYPTKDETADYPEIYSRESGSLSGQASGSTDCPRLSIIRGDLR